MSDKLDCAELGKCTASHGLCVVDFVFFVVGVVRTYSFLTELKKSEYAVKLFVHIAIAKGLINHGM